MKFVLIILTVISLNACASTANTNLQNSNNTPTPSPTAKVASPAQNEQTADEEQNKAIQEFLAKKYRGWKLKAIAADYRCNEFSSSPCDLLIENGKTERIISVMMRRFEDTNGKSFLVVFEARPVDLSLLKIEEIKESERQATLENLDYDNCSDICDAHD